MRKLKELALGVAAIILAAGFYVALPSMAADKEFNRQCATGERTHTAICGGKKTAR